MALTVKRWLLWGAVGCLALTVGFWPGGGSDSSLSWYGFGAAGKNARHWMLNEVASRYAVLRIRDSVLRHAGRSDGSRVLSVPTLALVGQPAARLASAIDTLSRLLAPAANGVHSTVVAIPTRSRRLPDGEAVLMNWSWYALPAATDHHLCVVVPQEGALGELRKSAQDSLHTTVAEVAAKLLTILGPCAFYTEFGEPGPQIEAWLRNRAYNAVADADWLFPVSARVDSSTEDWSDALSYNIGARACAHRVEVCREGLLKIRPLPGYMNTAIARRVSLLDPSHLYLGDLVRQQGRVRFEHFWTSQRDPEGAFQEAFGVPIAEWTSAWLLSRAERPLHFGAGIAGSAVVWALGLILGFALLTVPIAARRQVG
ncbi:MAG TPA: hypothetical protein VKB63_06575 [Gemmatimonadales bacterium]|nr:hypothetical protein [Gemmatimonadales bacterium]